MAKVAFKMPDSYMKRIETLGDKATEIIPEALNAGAEVMEGAIRTNLTAAIGKGTKYTSRSAGENGGLLSALGISPVKVNRSGVYNVKVGFREPRAKQTAPKKFHYSKRLSKIYKKYTVAADRGYYQVSNAMVATVLEYGKQGQPPKPFLKPAKRSAGKACVAAMKAKFENEVEKI